MANTGFAFVTFKEQLLFMAVIYYHSSIKFIMMLFPLGTAYQQSTVIYFSSPMLTGS